MTRNPIDQFIEIAHSVVWCTMATVDRSGRPRSRVVHPVWERDGDGIVGWLGTRRTPLKVAHLAGCPHVSVSYWDPRHDVAVAECAAAWVPDEDRAHAWKRLAGAPEPAGYDPATIWPDGPDGGSFAALRLDPWRLRSARAGDIGSGEFAVWRPAAASAA